MQIYTNFGVYLPSTVQSVSLFSVLSQTRLLNMPYSTSFSSSWSSSDERICRMRPLWAIPKLIHNSKLSPVNGLFICHFHNSICTAQSDWTVFCWCLCSHLPRSQIPAQRQRLEIQHPGTYLNLWPLLFFKFITPVFVLLIMKNISHLNQYDPASQTIEPVFSLFKNCPLTSHRAMIDYWMTRAKT